MEEATSIKLARELRRVANRMAFFQDDGEYSHIDKFREIIWRISRTCQKLIRYKGRTVEEKAEICLSLLVGYSVTIRNVKNIQEVLDRSYKILPRMSPSFLKCSLLVYCYGEVYEQELADEAKQIMATWSELTEEEKRIKQLLADMEGNELISNPEQCIAVKI